MLVLFQNLYEIGVYPAEISFLLSHESPRFPVAVWLFGGQLSLGRDDVYLRLGFGLDQPGFVAHHALLVVQHMKYADCRVRC